jgi:hypothetical protein
LSGTPATQSIRAGRCDYCDTAPCKCRNWTIGIDLGQVYDYSAAAVVERLQVDTPQALSRMTVLDHHHVRYIKRWDKGSGYDTVVRETGELMRRANLLDAMLVIDATGVGREVAGLYRQAYRLGKLGRFWPKPYVITGAREISEARGLVPKRELVGKMQTLLQSGRLKIADSLPMADTLRRELLAFKVKMTPGGQETYESAREADHDDLVLAVALACWHRHTATEPRRLEPEEARA